MQLNLRILSEYRSFMQRLWCFDTGIEIQVYAETDNGAKRTKILSSIKNQIMAGIVISG
jgi:hypothetical protein